MDASTARSFADSWLHAWNAHDLGAVLAHFTDDATFSSPLAAQLIEGSDGVLQGKEEIRAYWEIGLQRIPDLRFEIENLYAGVDVLVINYRNHAGGLVCEVLRFGADGLVAEGSGTYLSADAAEASGAA